MEERTLWKQNVEISNELIWGPLHGPSSLPDHKEKILSCQDMHDLNRLRKFEMSLAIVK